MSDVDMSDAEALDCVCHEAARQWQHCPDFADQTVNELAAAFKQLVEHDQVRFVYDDDTGVIGFELILHDPQRALREGQPVERV